MWSWDKVRGNLHDLYDEMKESETRRSVPGQRGVAGGDDVGRDSRATVLLFWVDRMVVEASWVVCGGTDALGSDLSKAARRPILLCFDTQGTMGLLRRWRLFPCPSPAAVVTCWWGGFVRSLVISEHVRPGFCKDVYAAGGSDCCGGRERSALLQAKNPPN